MSENILPNIAADRLLGLLLSHDKVKEGCVIHKKIEENNTVIQIIHRIEGKRTEEHCYNQSISRSI